jgi:WD40 repeat protein
VQKNFRAATIPAFTDGSFCVSRQAVPPVIPDYELLRPIGRGAYGEVWLARSVTGVYRAAKVVYRDSFEEARPFEREFDGIQRFEPVSRSQENQIAILHVGRNEAERCFYYVMELADDAETEEEVFPDKYVPKTLREMRARHTRLPAKECLSIGIALTRALAHLHRNGLVHRDIKPSNVIFVHGVPKLADIGLVSAADTSVSFVGTEGFVPPEGPGSVAADLYSLGKVLYEISTGRDRRDFPKLPEDLEHLPDKRALLELNEVTAKACDPVLARRYASAEAMHDDLLLLQAGKSVRRLHLVERRFQLVAKYGIAATALTLAAASAFLWASFQAHKAKENFALSEKNRIAAEQALFESQMNQARARRMTGVAGRRFETLEFFRKAAAGTNGRDLRNEAIASLVLPDFRPVKEWSKLSEPNSWTFDTRLRRYFTNDAAGNLTVRDVDTDRELASLPGRGAPLTAMLCSRNDRFLATSDTNGNACIWNLETQQPTTIDFPKRADLVGFTPDSRAMLVKHADGSFHFLNPISGIEEKVWKGPFAFARVYFNASGEMFCGWVTNELMIYESTSGTLLKALPHPETIHAMAWHPDGRRLATSCGKTIHFWDTTTGREIGIGQGHESRVVGLAYDDLGDVLISTGWDHTLRLWQTDTFRELVKSSFAGSHIQVSPDGRRLGFQSWDTAHAELWQVANGQEMRRFELSRTTGRVYRITYHGGFSRDGSLVHLDASDGTYLFDARSLQSLAVLPSKYQVAGGGFGRAGTNFIHASVEGLRLWPVEPATADKALRVGPPQQFHSADVRRVAGASLTADGKFLVAVSNHSFWVFNLIESAPVVRLQSPARLRSEPAISVDNRWIAIGGADDTLLRIWDAHTGQPATNLNIGASGFAAFSPDNQWMVTATPYEYCFWTIGTWKAGVCVKRSVSSPWIGAAFSPDGTVVALADGEHIIHLYVTGTDHELAAFPAGHLVTRVCFSPDGTKLLVIYEPGVAELWDLRLMRQELAELNLDWESPPVPAPLASKAKAQSAAASTQ